MRQRNIRDSRVEQLHKGCQRDGDGDDPRIYRRPFGGRARERNGCRYRTHIGANASFDATRDRSVASKRMVRCSKRPLGRRAFVGGSREMRKGEQTRQEIIREAAPIFNQRGYDGAALSDLMRATGLEKGGIYRHFSSKEALAAEAFDYAWRETLDARIHDLDAIPNTVDRLKQLVANFVERRGIIPGGCPLLNTAVDTDDGNSVLRARARKALRGWRGYLISMIRAGIKAREIRSTIHAKKLATLIISSLEGAIMVYRLERTEEALRAVQAHLGSYLETEVRARPK